MEGDKRVSKGVPGDGPAGAGASPPLPINPETGKPYTQDELRAMAEDRNAKIQQGIDLLKSAFGPNGFILVTAGGITYAVGDPFRMAAMLERAAKNANDEGNLMISAGGWNDKSLSAVPPQMPGAQGAAGARPHSAPPRKPNLKAAPPPEKNQEAASGDAAGAAPGGADGAPETAEAPQAANVAAEKAEPGAVAGDAPQE